MRPLALVLWIPLLVAACTNDVATPVSPSAPQGSAAGGASPAGGAAGSIDAPAAAGTGGSIGEPGGAGGAGLAGGTGGASGSAALTTSAGLDTSFGDAGRLHLDDLAGKLVAVRATNEGKLVLAVLDASGITIVRRTADGAPDPTFVSPAPFAFEAIAVAPDDAVLVTGRHPDAGFVLRFDASGTPDDGYATAAAASLGAAGVSSPGAIDVTPDGGAFVVFGPIDGSTGILRLDGAGALVTSFGDHGVVRAPLGGSTADFLTVRALADGGTFVGGGCEACNASPKGFVARLDATGALVPAFANAGISVLGMKVGFAASLDVAPNGTVVLGGTFFGVDSSSAVSARVAPDGDVVASIDQNAGSQAHSGFGGVVVQGAHAVGAFSHAYEHGDGFRIERRAVGDFSLDPSFGAAGVVDLPPPSNGVGAVLQPSGRVIAGGNDADGIVLVAVAP